jgi:hypothetical protein
MSGLITFLGIYTSWQLDFFLNMENDGPAKTAAETQVLITLTKMSSE